MEFSEYAAARRTGLVRATVLLGCGQPDAEEVVQLAFLRVMHNWRRIEEAAEPDGEVYTILLTTLREAIDRRWNGELPVEILPEEPETPDQLVGLTVRRALADLTLEQREILVLRFYADLAERETATALHLRPGALKLRTTQALEALSTDRHLSSERHDAR